MLDMSRTSPQGDQLRPLAQERCGSDLTKLFVLVIASILMFGCSSARQANRPYHMTESQWASVQTLLQSHPGWRLAVDSDSKNTVAIKRLRDSTPVFEPYFAVRTANSEGTDFAVVLIRNGQFKVFYFRADGSRYRAAQEVATVDWLNDGRIQLEGDTLDVAPFQSDEIFKFAWDSAIKRLELVPDSAQ
jgi:hypothetical protein